MRERGAGEGVAEGARCHSGRRSAVGQCSYSLAGQPLDPSARAFFEPRVGRELSHVRVHTDQEAQQSAQDVTVLACTVGTGVIFDAGRYAPGTPDGQRLLPYELTHVMQQSCSRARGAAQVQRAVASTDCRGGVNSAPADPTATLTAVEARASGLAQSAAILAAVGSASATMGIDMTTRSVGQAFAARFGLPPAVRRGFQN